MNNKRVIFYLISLFVLMSFYVIYVLAAGESVTTAVTSFSSSAFDITKNNITTGANLNVTCTGVFNSSPDGGPALAINSLHLYHNLNGTGPTGGLGLNISTNLTSLPFIGIVNTTTTGDNFTANFVVYRNTSLAFDANGALSGTVSPLTDGNYTFGCWAGINVTNATFNTAAFRLTWSTNISLTIDRQRPNFTVTSLNVTDGTNTITYDLMNGTLQGGPKAYLRNNSKLEVKVTVNEPYFGGGSAKLYWVTNGTPLPLVNDTDANNPGNMTMNLISPSGGKLNISVLNGSLRFAGVGPYSNGSAVAQTDRLSTLAEGTTLTFIIVANDSADNIVNLSNNGKGFNFTIDNLAPEVTFSLDKTKINVLETIKATCSANDTSAVSYRITYTKPSGAQIIKNPLDGKATFSNTDTGEAGKYTVECEVTDSVSYKTAKSVEVTATYESTEGDTSIEEEIEQKVAEVDLSKQVGGTTTEGKFSGIKGESTTFTLDGETQHTLTFLDIGSQEVTLRFESTPVDVNLKIGETKEVDLNADGNNDIIVTLNAITDGDADVTVKPIKQMPTTIPEETPTTVPDTTESETAKPSKTGMIVLVIVILVVVVAAYFLLKGKKNKKGEIRFTSKDLASEFNF